MESELMISNGKPPVQRLAVYRYCVVGINPICFNNSVLSQHHPRCLSVVGSHDVCVSLYQK